MAKKDQKKWDSIIQEIRQYRERDFSFEKGEILGSMCTTPHPIAQLVYDLFLDTNLGDPDLFPGTKQLEEEVIAFHKSLVHAPQESDGVVVSGGTEGNITAIWLAKNLSQKKEILIPETAHFSFEKIASLMDLSLIPIPVNECFKLEASEVKKHLSNNTAAVVGIAGSTELGTIDDIPAISEICEEEHVFFHVDAAFGGFVLPFLNKNRYNVPEFDFKLPGVSSISVDAHKMGYSVIPMGAVIVRDHTWLDAIRVASSCVSGQYQSTLLGTRSGAPIAASYAVFKYLGMDGYKQVVSRCMDLTDYTYHKLKNLGLNVIQPPTLNVIAIQLRNVDEVANSLSNKGFKVNVIKRLSAIRIVLMPQITKEIIDAFLPVLETICQQVGEL